MTRREHWAWWRESLRPWREFGYTLERGGGHYWSTTETAFRCTVGVVLWYGIFVPVMTIITLWCVWRAER